MEPIDCPARPSKNFFLEAAKEYLSEAESVRSCAVSSYTGKVTCPAERVCRCCSHRMAHLYPSATQTRAGRDSQAARTAESAGQVARLPSVDGCRPSQCPSVFPRKSVS